MTVSPIEKTKPEMGKPTGPWRASLLLLAAAWIALASIPAIPSGPQAGVDPSWMWGLHKAQDLGLVHGRDLVWTYGPIAWLAVPVTPAEHLVPVLVFRFAMWGVWVAAMLRLIFSVTSKAMPLIVFATVGSLAVNHDVLRHFIFPDSHLDLAIVSVALLPLAFRSQWVYLELGALAFLCGLATMVKFTLAVEAVGILGCLLVTVFVRERTARKGSLWKMLAVGMVFPLTAVGIYWASTGHIGTIGPYLWNAIEISAGYSEGMSIVAPSIFVNAALLTMVALLVGVPALSYRRRLLIAGWGPAAIAAFVAFKHGTVRGDVHLLPMQANLALAACFMLVVAAQQDRKFIVTIQIIALGQAFFALIGMPDVGSNIRDRLSLTTSVRVADALLNLDTTRDGLKSQAQKNLVALKASQAVQDIIANGTVEVVPKYTAQVFANGWRWAPRPVFQPYQALTPAHDLLNAAHLRSHRAADFVLVHGESTDQRHPFAEDPLSWRALLEGYEVVWQNDETALFAKRSEPHRFSLVEIASTSVGWDRKIPVPGHNGPLVVEFIGKRSLIGRLSNLFFRVNPVHMEVTYESGEKRSWRVVRPNLVHGFVVQPFPADLSEIAQFTNTGDVPERRVASVRLIPTTPSQFHPKILARWFHLKSGPGNGPS